MLLRKRALRRDDSYCDADGREVLVLFCPKRNENFELVVAELTPELLEPLQQRMVDLLYSGTESASSADPQAEESTDE